MALFMFCLFSLVLAFLIPNRYPSVTVTTTHEAANIVGGDWECDGDFCTQLCSNPNGNSYPPCQNEYFTVTETYSTQYTREDIPTYYAPIAFAMALGGLFGLFAAVCLVLPRTRKTGGDTRIELLSLVYGFHDLETVTGTRSNLPALYVKRNCQLSRKEKKGRGLNALWDRIRAFEKH